MSEQPRHLPEPPPQLKPKRSGVGRWIVIALAVIVTLSFTALYIAGSRAAAPSAHDAEMERLLSHVPDTPPVQPADPTSLSYDQFVSLRDGMSYDDVVSTLRAKGTLRSQSGDLSDWEWHARGAIISIMFRDGRLSSKTQVGLAP